MRMEYHYPQIITRLTSSPRWIEKEPPHNLLDNMFLD